MAADDPKDSASPRAVLHPTTVPGGTRIVGGTYEVERLLKAGGMGEVYRGRNVFNGEPVAIKIVLGSQATDDIHTKLFEREALVLSKLAHEAIVRYYVYTVDPVIGRPCLVMEFVPGPSVMERMAEGPMPLEDVRTVLRRVASGLEAAHKRGVIHRDLSPDNIILEDGLVEHAKLIDFGIAKSGAIGQGTMLEGRIAGKYNYMAPEQLGLAGGVIDERADIYSLGLVVVGVFRGSALNMGENPFEAITKRQSLPDISAVPPEMQGIVARMLAPDPADRPRNMPALIKLLDQTDYLPPPVPQAVTTGGTVLGGEVPVQQPPIFISTRATPPPAPQGSRPEGTLINSAPQPPLQSQPRGSTVVTPVQASERPASMPAGTNAAAFAGIGQPGLSALSPLVEGLGKSTSPDAVAPRSMPAQKSGTVRGLWFLLGGVAVVAVAVGIGFFAMQGGGPGTGPGTVTPSETPAPTASEDAAKVKEERDWLMAKAKDQCLYFRADPAGSGPVALINAQPGGADGLTADFVTKFAVSPKIATVTDEQCAALKFAMIEEGVHGAKPSEIVIDHAPGGVLNVGTFLTGSVKGSRGRTSALFIISSTGGVANLTGELVQDGQADAHFYNINIDLAPGTAALDLLLLSITTDSPNDEFIKLAKSYNGYTAETVMPRLALLLKNNGRPADIALEPFRLQR